ncbi:DUF2637 domain-containing protein [Xylanimonas allomyrinae]|nr:DUF2637 domain-containing protein [Xylanimonas allomyrinae]
MSRRGFAFALWPGVLLCVVAAVMAFTLSFTALRAVGIASGISPRIGWMFPLTIDTVILFGTWAAFRFRARGRPAPGTRGCSWSCSRPRRGRATSCTPNPSRSGT